MNSVNRIKKLRIQNKNLHLQIVALVGLIMSGEKPKRAPRRGGSIKQETQLDRIEKKLDRLTEEIGHMTKIIESWNAG